jgi:hypothetical protein
MSTNEMVSGTPEKVRKGHLKFADGTLIPVGPLPEGQFIVHNNEGGCSFRISVQEGVPKKLGLIRCNCDLGGNLKPDDVPVHYRYPKRIYRLRVEE